MTVHIDLAKAQSLVAECIAERGSDYVYEKQEGSCMYVHGAVQEWDYDADEYTELDVSNATPGCLVGLAMHKAGITLEFMGGPLNFEGSSELLDAAADAGLITYTEQADAYLGNCQASQDAGASWGLANEHALKGEVLRKERNYSDDSVPDSFKAERGQAV